MKIQRKLFSFMNPFLNQFSKWIKIWSFQVREIVEEICIVIVQKLIYQVDKNRPSKLKKFYFDDHLKWHTLKFLVLIWSGIFEACLSVGLKIFDLSCEVFSPWKIKSKKWGKNCTQKLGKNITVRKIVLKL